ncbi:hypothetical protein WJX82_005190 [Trebouxia sp. C0006]
MLSTPSNFEGRLRTYQLVAIYLEPLVLHEAVPRGHILICWFSYLSFAQVLGMTLFCQLGFFSPKVVPTLQVLPLAAAYVGYVVLNNLSLRLNTVGFYQISKICIMPTLIAIEIALFGKYPSKKVLAAVVLPIGLFEALPDAHTLMGFKYTLTSVTAIAVSSVLGLLVSLSTFLVIGATSSLTYNIVGHLKTVTILTGGCLIFGDTMTVSKLAGVTLAMVGIAWYSHMQLTSMQQPKSLKPKTPDAETGHAQQAALR